MTRIDESPRPPRRFDGGSTGGNRWQALAKLAEALQTSATTDDVLYHVSTGWPRDTGLGTPLLLFPGEPDGRSLGGALVGQARAGALASRQPYFESDDGRAALAVPVFVTTPEEASPLVIVFTGSLDADDRSFAVLVAHLVAAALSRAQAVSELHRHLELLGSLAHELRTPLHVILAWSDVLRRRRPKPSLVDQGLERIARNARIEARWLDLLLES
jgi:signal transduction histidine kinase